MGRDQQSINWAELADPLVRAAGVLPPAVSEIEPAAVATMQLVDFSQHEYDWLRRGGIYQGGGPVAAVAGQLSAVEIRITPGRTDVVAVIDAIIACGGAAGNLKVGMGASVLGAFASGVPRDDRLLARPSGAEVGVGTAAVISLGTNAPTWAAQANMPIVIPGPWVITGLQSLFAVVQTANTSGAFAVFWHERPLQTLER